MNDYVICFRINVQGNKVLNKVVWDGKDAKDALRTFWGSFDAEVAKEVSNVRIFDLVDRHIELDGEFQCPECRFREKHLSTCSHR